VVSRVNTVVVESLGVVLPRDRCWMHECAFVIPASDLFYSIVTRDPFPDAERRAFTFHFRPGVTREDQVRRACEVLRVSRDELGEPVEDRVVLPAPALGHAQIVEEIDRLLAGGKLALGGNYFNGLAIEDCVTRSNEEWARIAE
jgi:UDP-galactopyranose mutase